MLHHILTQYHELKYQSIPPLQYLAFLRGLEERAQTEPLLVVEVGEEAAPTGVQSVFLEADREESESGLKLNAALLDLSSQWLAQLPLRVRVVVESGKY